MIARKTIPVPTFYVARRVTPPSGAAKYRMLFLLWLVASTATFGQEPTTPATPAVEAVIGEESQPLPTPATATELPIYASRNERDNQLLARANPEEVRWLETPNGQILALFRPTENRTTKGVVLFLHAAETPPGWPPMLENARRTLPQHGWVTLAVALPAKTTPPLPDRDPAPVTDPAAIEDSTTPPSTPPATTAETTATPEAAATPESTTSTSEPEPVVTRAELIAERVTAALNWLAQEGHTSVVLMVDNSSVVDSLAHLKTTTETPVSTLVLVNMQAQEELTTAELEAIFGGQTLPVMDIFFAPAHGQITAARKRHKAVALRNKLEIYHQHHILSPQQSTLDESMSFWVERLRGFIEQQAEGKAKP